MISCTACFDERSLSFHAIGYARGCHKPAVVITSSGTAISNLLPAVSVPNDNCSHIFFPCFNIHKRFIFDLQVVEASQDFLPLILLTADRPPELLDTGANQAINQVCCLFGF